ncbi:MAG TPA: T9SS type A sorting domain-containing protein, partial [Prolixibacteraceae bacterium]|nr:T9SS type A sorting domain-containing protein [Prolixibacteraceae bacterium]
SFEQLIQLSASNNSFTDFAADPEKDYQYFISFEVEGICFFEQNTKSAEMKRIKSNVVSTNKNYTGLSGQNKTCLLIYPNPAADILVVETNKIMDYKFKVFNFSGMQVFEGHLANPINKIDVKKLQSGAYFIQIIGKEIHYQQKFIKY